MCFVFSFLDICEDLPKKPFIRKKQKKTFGDLNEFDPFSTYEKKVGFFFHPVFSFTRPFIEVDQAAHLGSVFVDLYSTESCRNQGFIHLWWTPTFLVVSSPGLFEMSASGEPKKSTAYSRPPLLMVVAHG